LMDNLPHPSDHAHAAQLLSQMILLKNRLRQLGVGLQRVTVP
jgi:hypothetical protein